MFYVLCFMPHFLNKLYSIALISLFFLLFFGLGYTAMAEKRNKSLIIKQIDYSENLFVAKKQLIKNKINSNYVASINGSLYYNYKCALVGRIKNENRIWFLTSAEALLSGYKEKKNCP